MAGRRDTRARRGRRELLRRRRAIFAAGAIAFAAGVGAAALTGEPDRAAFAARYASAWARQDWRTMHSMLTPEVRERLTIARFAELHREALATATAGSARGTVRLASAPRVSDTAATLPLAVRTRVFGTIRGSVRLPLREEDGELAVDWTRNLRFPGLPPGAELEREVELPPRGTLLTRDGKVLAQGPDRTPAPGLEEVARNTVGSVGPVPPERAEEVRALGVPAGSAVGLNGLERALEDRLVGRPGGRLVAGGRVLAAASPKQAPAVRTSVDVGVERAAIEALGGRLGGVVALDPRSGEVLGFAGIAFSGLQPPGSTFKLITLSGALEEGVVKPSDSFPVETKAVLSGVDLENADGESCGGSLTEALAESCNSVFAPLGAKLGAEKLVATAEAYGFDGPPPLPGAARSTLPPPEEIGDDLAVGSTAIGQGRVQATALQMALVAATIAREGRRPALTLALPEKEARAAASSRVVSARTARTVARMMEAVVKRGTGTAAAIPGVRVAGKTGTAELETTARCSEAERAADPEGCAKRDSGGATDTTAWFVAEAPADAPRVAVGVLLVKAGAGGDAAAPVAKAVLRAALRRG